MTDFLQMARQAYTTSTSFFDTSIRPQVEAGIRQFQGVHPKGSKYHSDLYKARSRFFRPKTRTTIRKNEAVGAEAFFSTKDVVNISTEDDNNKPARAGAALMQSIVGYRLKKTIPWFLICMGAYQDAQAVGVCISHQYWEYDVKKGLDRPCVELLPVENLRIDPGANWADPINTSPYLIRLIPMYVKDVRGRMATLDTKTGQPKWKKLEDSQILAAMNAGGDSTRQTRERGRTDSTDQAQAIRDFAVVWVHQNIIEIDGEDLIWYTLGTIAMLTDPVELKKVYFHGKRPYVMGYSVIETHKPYPDGVAGITKDTQAEINEIANQTRDTVKFALNKRYFVKRGTQVDLRSLTRNTPGSATLMNDPEKDVKVQETGEVNPSAYQEQDRLNLDFDDVAGAFSPSSVQSNRKLNETVGGMETLSTNANQVGNYQLRTFVETWMEPALRQLVLLEQYYETDTVLLAKAGKDADLESFGVRASFDELLMQELTLDVNVGIGATNPQEQVNNFIRAMGALRDILADGVLEKHGIVLEEVIAELFGKMGYKDGKRFFGVENEDLALTSAKNTIAELQQQLAQKVSPELVAAQIKKLDAEIEALGAKTQDTIAAMVKKNMETLFAAMQAGEVVASVPSVAPIADSLAAEAGFVSKAPPLVAPLAPDPALTLNPIKSPKTGVEFQPGAGQANVAGPVAGDTTPLTPAAPASPGEGANAGIETMRADTEGAAV